MARANPPSQTLALTPRIELTFLTGLMRVSSQIGDILQDRNVVLVVDDDLGVLGGLECLLRAHAYEPILFSSAEAFKNHTDILDINLNDGTGIELRQGLKAAGVSVPVIYMTGNEDPAVRTAALDSGCIAFLIKPFSVQALMEPLKKASAGRSQAPSYLAVWPCMF
jgi:FixJ family two-component response regulator